MSGTSPLASSGPSETDTALAASSPHIANRGDIATAKKGEKEKKSSSPPPTARMPVDRNAELYNMEHQRRGRRTDFFFHPADPRGVT